MNSRKQHGDVSYDQTTGTVSKEVILQQSLNRALRLVGEKDVNLSFAQDHIAQLGRQLQEKDKSIMDLTAKLEKAKDCSGEKLTAGADQ